MPSKIVFTFGQEGEGAAWEQLLVFAPAVQQMCVAGNGNKELRFSVDRRGASFNALF